MKRNLVSSAAVVILAVALIACSDDTTPPAVDSGPKLDVGQTDGTTGNDGQGTDGPAASSRDYVFAGMTVPTTVADAQKYAFDYNNDGAKDNALGAILAALITAVPGMDLQGELDQNLRNGRIVLLARVTAKDFSGGAATLQGWTGEETTCCATKPCSEQDANQSCFSGGHAFKVAATSPQNAVLMGDITGGQLAVGPGELQVLLPIGKFPAKVMLKQARLQGALGQDGLTGGILTGVVTKDDLDNQVVPAVAQVLDGELNDATTKQSVKDAIKQAFDTNNDNKIDASEVADNALIKALLAGDVDIDNDGTKELSAGIGFRTVGCKINL